MLIAKNIKFLREAIGQSQALFGQILGVTRGMIRDYEMDRSKPKRPLLDKIERLFGLAPWDIKDKEIDSTQIHLPPPSLINALEVLSDKKKLVQNSIEVIQEIGKINDSQVDNPILKKTYSDLNDQLNQSRDEIDQLNDRLYKLLQPFIDDPFIIDNKDEFLNTLDFFKIISIFKHRSFAKWIPNPELQTPESQQAFEKHLDAKLPSMMYNLIIKRLRQKWDFTIDGLSRLSGITNDRVSRIEKGSPLTPEEIDTLITIENRLNDISEFQIKSEYYKDVFQTLKYGLILKRRREESSMSQKQLADEVGLPEQSIIDIENGYFIFVDKSLEKVWDYFKIQIPEEIYFEGEVIKTNSNPNPNDIHTEPSYQTGERRSLHLQKLSKPKKFISIISLIVAGEYFYEQYLAFENLSKQRDLSPEEKSNVELLKQRVNNIAKSLNQETGKSFSKPDNLNLNYVLDFALDDIHIPFFAEDDLDELKKSYLNDLRGKNEEIEIYVREIHSLKKQVAELKLQSKDTNDSPKANSQLNE